MIRIYTCTPVVFGGGADFFARDSGLLCRGLQSIGVDSRAVMPGASAPEDEKDLIRTPYLNLETPAWWKDQQLDAVVLYAWGRPKFRKVAKAVQEAGIFLILNLDSGGPVSPLSGLTDWMRAQWIFSGSGRSFLSYLRFVKLTLRGITLGLLATDPMRSRHLKCGNIIAPVSPASAEHFRRLCHRYGGDELSTRIEVIPHPVETSFRYSGVMKHRQITCVGRWNDSLQKRSELLMHVIDTLLARDHQVTAVIVGRSTPEMEIWHRLLEPDIQKRVIIAGIADRKELAILLDQSQVFYSPSAYESFGIAAAEALCSGCSVVAEQALTMPAFDWFISEMSGQLIRTARHTEHADSLLDELDQWQKGKRDARLISTIWCERLHADHVAQKIVDLFSN
ncbi:MAG: glycosyltransferase family 4 protein [Verrucomicrobiota bacterium]